MTATRLCTTMTEYNADHAVTELYPTVTAATNAALRTRGCRRYGKLVVFSVTFDLTGRIPNVGTILTTSGLPLPTIDVYTVAANSTRQVAIILTTEGKVIAGGSTEDTGTWFGATFVYITA